MACGIIYGTCCNWVCYRYTFALLRHVAYLQTIGQEMMSSFMTSLEITTNKQITFSSRVSNRTWTRTVNPNEPFHFGEPKPNLNQQNFTSVNLNQTWTLKIVLKWTRTEPEPLTKVRIYFSISECRWRWYTHKKSSGELQQDQQFLLFFSGRNE